MTNEDKIELRPNKPNKPDQPKLVDAELVMHTVDTILKPIVNQQKREHNFGRLKFYLFIAFFIGVLGLNFFAEDLHKRFTLHNDYVSLVRLDGEIMPGAPASPEVINPLLEKAFSDTTSKGVILQINSPGGTPVAAGEIRSRIISLREEYPDKDFVVVGGDYMTSGAYLIASGGDTLYANQASLVGSIGVIIRSFGYNEIAKKVGVERRIINAGDNKNRFDSWLPLSRKDKVKLERQLGIVHKQFIAQVKESRGDRLKFEEYPDMFSGDYWTGDEALKMGLIDGTMTLAAASNKHFGTTRFRVYKPSQPLLGNLLGSLVKTVSAEVKTTVGTYPKMMLSIQ